MRDMTAVVSTANPDRGSLELTENMIRTRAYQFYEERGYEGGPDLEDLAPSRGRNNREATRCS